MPNALRMALCSVLLTFVFAFHALAQQAEVFNPPLTGKITTRGVNLRTGPATEYPAIGQSHAIDIAVEVLEKDERWYRIRVDGREGWISEAFIQVDAPPVAEAVPAVVSPPVPGAAGAFSEKVAESAAPSALPESSATPAERLSAPPTEVPAESAPSLDQGTGQQGVFIRRIDFKDNTVISSEKLAEAVKEFTDRELALEDMSALTDRVTLLYQEKGFILARAYLPEQEIKDGVLTIAVAEGRVGKLKTTGRSPYSDTVIKRYFEPQQKQGVVKESSLERALVMSNEVPNLKTDLVLKKGDEAGSVDVVINARDTSRMTLDAQVKVDYNNFGSPLVGPDRYGVEGLFTDHRWGSQLKLRTVTGNTPENSTLVHGEYSLPVNVYGTKIGGNMLWSNYIIGQELSQLGLGGTTRIYGGWASHPVIKKKSMALEVSGGLEYRETLGEVLNQTTNVDNYNVWWASMAFDNLDRFLGKNIVSVTGRSGHISPDAQYPNTRQEVPLSFWRANANVARVQKLFGFTSLLVRAAGQITEDRLLPSEEFSLGGYGSVRGWEPTSFLGDYGYSFSGELLFAPPGLAEKQVFGQRLAQLVQLALFYDTGRVWINEPTPDEYRTEFASGYGWGLRLFYKDLFTFKYDLGIPTTPANGKPKQIHYFLGTFKFF
ncbi:MAG: POTRA domain-containing protein [Pseudomonadota bacterium]